MPRIRLWAIVVAVALTGAAPVPDVPAGFQLARDGATLVHEGSGFRFPRKVGHFTRSAETSHDPDGQYVEIHYSYTPAGQHAVEIRMSLVYIEGMTAAEHYAAMAPQAQRYFSGIVPVSQGPVTVRRDGAPAYRGIFTGGREGVPWEFSLTTIELGGWDGRVVTAYTVAEAQEARTALDGFVAAFPGRRQSAGK